MLKIIFCFFVLVYPLQTNAQISHISAKKQTTSAPLATEPAPKPNPTPKTDIAPNPDNEPNEPRLTGYLRDYGDQKDARNIMIVAEVARYKLGDEKLAPEFAKLEYNKEYNKKIKIIMDKLNNNKYPDSKNRQVMNILNEAGNKLYNLLAD